MGIYGKCDEPAVSGDNELTELISTWSDQKVLQPGLYI